MVAIFALIGEPLLQACRQVLSGSTLGLRETLSRVREFVRMGNLLAGRERQEGRKPGQCLSARCANERNAFGGVSMHRHRYQPEARLTIRPLLIRPAGMSCLWKRTDPMPEHGCVCRSGP